MEVDLENARCAALVLDVQELFMSPDGPFANTTVEPMIAALNTFLAGCRELACPVVFSSYVLRADLLDAGLLRDHPVVRAGHFSEGSPLVRIDRRVSVEEADIQLRHNRPSAFFRTDLESVLGSLGVDALLLAGLSVNNAVSATARDAFARDIPAVVVRDCTGAAPFEPAEAHDIFFAILDTWTAGVASASHVFARLRRA
jgi:nicotinamidase-related amidase